MGISTSNKYRRPSALGPPPPPPWAPVNHSPVLLRAPQPAPASPAPAAAAGRASWEPGRRGSRLASPAEGTWGVRGERAVASFPPLKKTKQTKTNKPLNGPRCGSRGEAAPERVAALPAVGRRGVRGRGASPDRLLRALGALLLRFKPTFRRFESTFHVVLRAGARGRRVHTGIPCRNTYLYR